MMIEILSPFLSHVNKKMKENFNRRGLSAGKIPSIFWPPEGPIGSALWPHGQPGPNGSDRFSRPPGPAGDMRGITVCGWLIFPFTAHPSR